MQRRDRWDPDLLYALAALVVLLLLGTGVVRLMGVLLPRLAWAGLGVVVVLLLITQFAILVATRNLES
jgi:hypothetical protein